MPVAAYQGNRVIKRGPQGETVYVNQFYTQRPGATGTKHVYAGTSRIVSKLVKQDTPGANPLGNTPFEKDLYFYHPDHLGTITDTNGKLYEHLEYFPFGESWVEENSNTQRTPFLFTAKELDEETGLYYFGARYYDPRTSVWQSADPILSSYLNGKPNGGVFSSKNLGFYTYVGNNPLIFTDPDGLAKILIDPGHGDRHSTNKSIDPGAVATHGKVTCKEKDLALSFSKAVGEQLTKLGHEVSYTRTGDVDDPSLTKLDWRTDMANEANPDLFISIHVDAAGSPKASGLGVYANKKGEPIKKAIEGAVTATPVRKPASKNLHVTREVKNSPSLLLEAGFITNPNDVNTIMGPDLAKEVAAGIDKGLPKPNE